MFPLEGGGREERGQKRKKGGPVSMVGDQS